MLFHISSRPLKGTAPRYYQLATAVSGLIHVYFEHYLISHAFNKHEFSVTANSVTVKNKTNNDDNNLDFYIKFSDFRHELYSYL